MEIIYIDELFVLNAVCDYFILLAAEQICGIVPKRLRCAGASLFGGAYSVLIYVPDFRFLSSPLWILTAAGVMGVIAFAGEAHPFRTFAVFILCGAMFAGVLYGISLAGNRPAFSFGALLLGFAVSYCAISLFYRARAKHSGGDKVRVRLEFMGAAAELYALSDTGNGLSDPMSGARVLIVSPEAVVKIFGADAGIFSLGAVECMEQSAGIPGLRGKLRLIPYRSIGAEGMLCAFVPDSLSVDGKKIKNPVAAVSESAHGEGFEGIW